MLTLVVESRQSRTRFGLALIGRLAEHLELQRVDGTRLLVRMQLVDPHSSEAGDQSVELRIRARMLDLVGAKARWAATGLEARSRSTGR